MLTTVGMTANGFSVALTVLAIAYGLFDVPANWVMKRFISPPWWLALLMLVWGVLTLGFAWVQNYATVVVLRFFIGAAEAGFFPGTGRELDSHGRY